MFCLKCGKEIKDGVKFCPHCGAVTNAGSAAPPAQETPIIPPPEVKPAGDWPDQGGGRKRRGRGLIVGGAVAAVLVIAVLVVALSSLFSSPKGQVEKALGKTLSAYAGARDALGLPEASALMKDRSYSQRFRLELNSISQELTGWYDLSALKGFGVRFESDLDYKGRKLDADMGLVMDGKDLMSFQMLVDGGKMYLLSPDFTKGAAYGFNTETLGEDLDRLGAGDDETDLKKIGFNLFDIMEAAMPSEEQTEDMQKALEDAGKALMDAAEVEKTGKQSVQVNGKSMDADAYHVLIPKSALKDYINALEDAMRVVDAEDMAKEILQSMGFDKATINDMLSEVETTDIYGQLADGLKEAVKVIGDVELDAYVSGGYLMKVEWSERIDGTKVKITLSLGGGSNYVDDISLEISSDGQELVLESTGDHAAKSGVFTDETTVRMRYNGTDAFRLSSDMRYEPKGKSGNFEWELKMDNAGSVVMEGQLTTSKDSIDLSLEDVSLKAAGTKLISFAMDYYMGPCDGMSVSVSSPKMLSDMDMDDLEDLVYDLEDNAEDWLYDVRDRIPAELLYLF